MRGRYTLHNGVYACMRIVIGGIAAIVGLEHRGVVSVEGKCRLVIGLC